MQIGKFLKKHRLLLIGIAVYIIVYIISSKYPPWLDMIPNYDKREWVQKARYNLAAGGFLKPFTADVLPENTFAKKIPIDIFYYGLADIAALEYFDIFFPAALITYFSLLYNKIIVKFQDEGMKKSEKYVISYLYTNALFYPLAFVIKFLHRQLERLDSWYSSTRFSDYGIVVDKCVGFITIIFVLILLIYFMIPTFMNYSYCFIYEIMTGLPVLIINRINEKSESLIGKNVLPQEFFVFVFAVIILLTYNLLMERLLEFLQKISLIIPKKIHKRIMTKLKKERNAI